MSLATYPRLVVIVGRANVGKSTLFNRILGARKNLVHNTPGVTRDRLFSRIEYQGESFYLCDTGGFEPKSHNNITQQLTKQAKMAIEDAALVLFVVDGRFGLHPVDSELMRTLRKQQKPFFVCVNKCDLPKDDDLLPHEFRKLGVEHIFPVSAEHARGIEPVLDTLVEKYLKPLPKPKPVDEDSIIRLALIGRPNAGKSSILNRLVGAERVIVDGNPGTTRDSIDVQFTYFGKNISLVDTAGIRRKSRMEDHLEAWSVMRSLACIEECHVSLLIIDAQEGMTDADLRVAGYAFERRKPLIIVVNKWDLVKDKDNSTSHEFEKNIRQDLRYLTYAPIVFVSALENIRISKLLSIAMELHELSLIRHTTSAVNKALQEALVKHTPPMIRNRTRAIKFFYATQVSVGPPLFVVFCSDPQELHFSYKRFLENHFREFFSYKHIPISVVFRGREQNERRDTHATNDTSA